jgi:hypothetical protein
VESSGLGAGIARKGWLEQTDVINALTLKSLLKELKKSVPESDPACSSRRFAGNLPAKKC